MTTQASYESPEGYDDLINPKEELVNERNNSMDFLTNYYKEPEQVNLVSDKITSLIDYDSDYMKQAQDSSEKFRLERGFLASDFNKDIGSAAAIDAVYDVAIDEAYTDVYNASSINKQNEDEYINAYDVAMRTLVSNDAQSYKEFAYSNVLDRMQDTQDNLNELQDKQFEYDVRLQEERQKDNLDSIYLKSSNDLAMRTLRNTSGLQKYYLNGYVNIMGSDINQPDKYDQLVGLGDQIDVASQAAVNQQKVKIGDNPYSISYVDYVDKYNQGDRTDEAFVYSIEDAKFEEAKFKEFYNDIVGQIWEQTNHQERDASSLWSLVTDKLGPQLDNLSYDDQAKVSKMQFFGKNKEAMVGSNTSLESVLTDMYLIGMSTTGFNCRGDVSLDEISKPDCEYGAVYDADNNTVTLYEESVYVCTKYDSEPWWEGSCIEGYYTDGIKEVKQY